MIEDNPIDVKSFIKNSQTISKFNHWRVGLDERTLDQAELSPRDITTSIDYLLSVIIYNYIVKMDERYIETEELLVIRGLIKDIDKRAEFIYGRDSEKCKKIHNTSKSLRKHVATLVKLDGKRKRYWKSKGTNKNVVAPQD